MSKSEQYSFPEIINNFKNRIEGLEGTFPVVAMFSNFTLDKTQNEIKEFIESRATNIEKKDDDDDIKFTLPMKDHRHFERLVKKINRVTEADNIVPQTFIVTLVSEYDGFLGDLLRTIYGERPEKLDSCQKPIIFSDMKAFSSIDDVKEYVIEKEVESFLRESHIKQFDCLEKMLDMPLRKELAIWSDFVEICGRRNLFVHTKGVVSRQYLQICKANNCSTERIKLGDTLHVSPKYFRHAYNVFTEMAVKLVSVVWRKLKPDDLEKADFVLNTICYDLIHAGKYKLAASLLEFACLTLKNNHSLSSKLYFKVNLAQCYKWMDNQNKCDKVLNSEDWNVLDAIFRLSAAVLRDKVDIACNVMREIGVKGRILKEDYREWPLFKKFIKTDEFKKTYKEVFDEDFDQVKEAYRRQAPIKKKSVNKSIDKTKSGNVPQKKD